MTRPLIFLFPGQSSRDPEMLDRLEAVHSGVGKRARARIEARCPPDAPWPAIGGLNPPAGAIASLNASNLQVQLSVTAANLAYLELADAHGLVAQASAGMSLGEYSHLVHIGAIEAEACLDLIAARGMAYDRGPRGMMVAVQPVELAALEALTAQVQRSLGGGSELVAVSNVNSPSQCVIAGQTEAVDALSSLVEQELAAIPKVIEERIPMHCDRFLPVAEVLRPILQAAPWRPPARDYWPNVLGEKRVEPRRETLVELLVAHVHRRVEWSRTIDGLLAEHPGAILVEVGPRRNLAAVLGRRWHPETHCYSLDLMDKAGPESFRARAQEILDAAK